MQNYLTLTKKHFISGRILRLQVFFVILQIHKISIPLLIQYTVDSVIIGQNFHNIRTLIVIFSSSIAVCAFIRYYSNRYFMVYYLDRVKKIRGEMITACLNSEHRFYEKNNAGDMAYRIQTDVMTVSTSWQTVFGVLPVQLITILFIFYLFFISPVLTGITLFFLIVNIIVLSIYIATIEKLVMAYKNKSQQFSKILYEILVKIEFIKIFSIFKPVLTRGLDAVSKMNTALLNYFLREKKVEIITDALNLVWVLTLLFTGIFLIEANIVTIGTLFAFLFLSNIIFQPINLIVSLFKKSKEIFISSSRIIEYLNNTKSVTEGSDNAILKSRIEALTVKNLIINKDGKKLNEEINADIKGNGIVAITGNNGKGKTTFAKILLKLYNEYDGNITLNNINLRDISNNKIAGKIIYANNDDTIFNDTLQYNLNFGDENIDITRYNYLLNKLYVKNTLPHGMLTIIGQDGIKLSAGEKQLIYILRAAMRRPNILILDEPEIAIDVNTKKDIISTIKDLSKDMIVILITHNDDYLDLAGNIINFK
ncbi:MAG: ABC transporter ATP-binding protein/permease [Treponema sp.]|nr:ABC transporter ATP-binding protein/permease [Treponema sp.]